MIKTAAILLILVAGFFIWNLMDIERSTSFAKVKNISNPDSTKSNGENMSDKIIKTEEEWKKELTPEQYHILREKGD